jgi:putative transposase
MQCTSEVCLGQEPAMRIVSNVTGSMLREAKRSSPVLSRAARQRLAWIEHYQRHRNASLTCRYFGISRQTFYRWWKRYQSRSLASLENRSSRPHRTRPRSWTVGEIEAVRTMRERYPTWGKAKLQVLLAREGLRLSVSKVGRILRYLGQRRQLPVPVRQISARKRPWRRPYAIRKPKDYPVQHPGDLIQLDTLDVRPVSGVVLKHFSAHDVVSRYGVLDLHARATALTATAALAAITERMPFPVKAIQVDGGSEFMAEFEQACQARGIRLFALPPRSPKLNGCVERANRTHTEEFYEWSTADPTVVDLGAELRGWEELYNTVRPHQALGYRTPAEFLLDYHLRKEQVSPR